MELLITALIIALVIYGLERNKTRNTRLAGSTDIQDRDAERLHTELLTRACPPASLASGPRESRFRPLRVAFS